jgi:hypothetical protein
MKRKSGTPTTRNGMDTNYGHEAEFQAYERFGCTYYRNVRGLKGCYFTQLATRPGM